MRVLLVYWNPSRELIPAAPIGLAYVATATREAGHDVRVVDLVGSEAPADDLRAAVAAFAPDVVGISVRNIDNVIRQRVTWHLGSVATLTAAVRATTRAPIVLGGPAVSILGAAVLSRLDADFAVVGEGEEAFPALLAALDTARPYDGVAGVAWRDGDAVRATPPGRLARFGASGLADWIDWPAYERRGGTWPIQTKRGCPCRCSYCAYPAIEGATVRRRSPGDVADEIADVVARRGPRTFEFVDSTFNLPADHAEALCRELERRRLPVHFTAMGVNPRGASASLFTAMRRAGFNSMMVTPESASDTVLGSLHKGFTAAEVRETARLARASGIPSAWFFMLGGPGETEATVEETVSFVERHLDWRGAVAIFMTGVRVLPGTLLAAQLAADGTLAAGRDLAEPVFHLSPGVSEAWIIERINRAMAHCAGVVHAAEEGMSPYERFVDRVLHALGVAPPYWRFLPLLLRVPPVRAHRRRHPPLRGAPEARGPAAQPRSRMK